MIENVAFTIAFVFSLTLPTLTHSQSTSDLLEGVHPFTCNGSADVLVEDSGSWELLGNPTVAITRTSDGWRFGDASNGSVGFLQQEGREWNLQVLSSDGYERVECQELRVITEEIIEKIRPKLAEGIEATEEVLAQALNDLEVAHAGLTLARSWQSSSEVLAQERIQRLCTYMITYGHLNVLERSFPFEGEEYKLCE
jgi:hypothetical protein